MKFAEKIMNGIFRVMVLIFGLIHFQADAGFEDRRFEESRIRLAGDIKDILVQSGDCPSQSTCPNVSIIVTPIKGGVGVQLWGKTKGANTMQAILLRCNSFFLQDSSIRVIYVDFYSITKSDAMNLPFWKTARPEIVMNLKRDK